MTVLCHHHVPPVWGMDDQRGTVWGSGRGPWLSRTPCSVTAAGFRICRTGVRTTSRVLERMEHVHLQGPAGLTGGVGCAK